MDGSSKHSHLQQMRRLPDFRSWIGFTASLLIMAFGPLSAQTIAEKKQGISGGIRTDFDADTQELLSNVNNELLDKQAELQALYAQVQQLYTVDAPPEDFRRLLREINSVREEIAEIESNWRGTVTEAARAEGYALWNQPDSTLEQLVIDFGSQEYVYVIPPDIGKKKISVASTVPVPRALWTQMLEMILTQNGIGVRQLNPFLRQLYTLDETQTGLQVITNDRDDLEYLAPNARVGFFVSPDPSEVRRVGFFLEKFVNRSTTTLQMVGRDMLIVSTVGEIKEILKLYDFVTAHRGDTDYRLVPLRRTDTQEMSEVLEAMFEKFSQEEEVFEVSEENQRSRRRRSTPKGEHGLKVIPLKDVAQAVFLVGTSDEIARAERIIQEVEAAVGQARDKVVYTYRVKHSDPEEIAQVMVKVYQLLVAEGIGRQAARREAEEVLDDQQSPEGGNGTDATAQTSNLTSSPNITIVQDRYNDNPDFALPGRARFESRRRLYESTSLSIDPLPIRYDPPKEKEYNQGRDNFLVDPRTGNIIMVVDPLLLPRLQALLRRIDVPKKMVQLDVLLVEYRSINTNQFGLNLLSIGGACTSNVRRNCVRFSDTGQLVDPASRGIPALAEGVLQFMITRPPDGDMPGYDWIYRFNMSQDDFTVNSNPTVVTVNQEPANIVVNEEISIRTGEVISDTSQTTNLLQRKQFGTTITIVPTIHTKGDDPSDLWNAGPDYVTLDNDIVFDDILSAGETPNVLRRQVKNVARVADGQTVILGGLKRKGIDDSQNKVPCLGEIPGVGKLFSQTSLEDRTTDMFIFITPRIIYDPCEEQEKVMREHFARRPGDIPYFLCELDRARRCERERCFKQTMQILCGRRQERCVPWGDDSCNRLREGVYDYHGNQGMYYNGSMGSRGVAPCDSCVIRDTPVSY